MWVSFTYKRLQNCCYICGLLDHTHQECMSWSEEMEAQAVDRFPYGPWLVADLRSECFMEENEEDVNLGHHNNLLHNATIEEKEIEKESEADNKGKFNCESN